MEQTVFELDLLEEARDMKKVGDMKLYSFEELLEEDFGIQT